MSICDQPTMINVTFDMSCHSKFFTLLIDFTGIYSRDRKKVYSNVCNLQTNADDSCRAIDIYE